MRVFDISTIDKLSIGDLIEEDCPVEQLTDNCICLIAPTSSAIAMSAFEEKERFNSSSEDYVNTYELEVKESIDLENHPKLKERIKKYGDNLIIQLKTFGEDSNKFIVAKTDVNRVFIDIFRMREEADRISKFYFMKSVKALAIARPKKFMKLLSDAYAENDLSNPFLADRLMSSISVCACKCIVHHDIRGAAPKQDENEETAAEKSEEQTTSIMKKLNEYRKNPTPEAEEELDRFFSSIDTVTLMHYVLKLSPNVQKKFFESVSTEHMAQVSTLHVVIRKEKRIDNINKTDGNYRLYLKTNKLTPQHVHFGLRNGFIVYLIYLLDRKKRGDNAKNISIKDYKELFKDLYDLVYGTNGETSYNNMIGGKNSSNKKESLSKAMEDIRDSVGNLCKTLNETPAPFIVRNKSSHLAILPDHINLPIEIERVYDEYVKKQLTNIPNPLDATSERIEGKVS